jgi:hypothetical protein
MANRTLTRTPETVDALALAKRCRALTLAAFPAHKTSCIETTAVFARVAELLGAPATRLVCQVQAFSPKLAEQIRTNSVDEGSIGQPGIWSLAVGLPDYSHDTVGLIDEAANRFVGHVVCVAEDHLIDPTVDQLSRPEWDMPLTEPALFKLDERAKSTQVAVTRTAHGVVLKYVFFPDVPAPPAKSSKIVERLARGVAREFGYRG